MIDFISSILEKEDKCYYESNGVVVAFNKTNEFSKMDLVKKELYIDEKIYNTNFKKVVPFKYEKEELLINDRLFYHLKMIPNMDVITQDDFDLKLKEIKFLGQKPTLLLHSCCGPCSSYCLEYLHEYFDITIFYYNPNIDTIEEFNKRLDYQKKIIDSLGFDVKLIVPDYNHLEYLNYVKGYEQNKEGEKRCYLCYEERLNRLASFASGKYDFYTSTLSISPYKNSNWLNEIGIRLNKEYPNTHYLYANFKLHDGYKRSIELSKKYNLYRQDYCGCEFSYHVSH